MNTFSTFIFVDKKRKEITVKDKEIFYNVTKEIEISISNKCCFNKMLYSSNSPGKQYHCFHKNVMQQNSFQH